MEASSAVVVHLPRGRVLRRPLLRRTWDRIGLQPPIRNSSKKASPFLRDPLYRKSLDFASAFKLYKALP